MLNAAFNATVFAFLYGVPLLPFAGLAIPILKNGTVNVLVPNNELATPTFPLPGPNHDTIYSETVYDLSQNELVIHFPQIDADRYFNIALYDLFGSVFANLGTVTKTVPGKYLLRLPRSHGAEAVPYGIVTSTSGTKYEDDVVSPTTFGFINVRALLKNNGSDLVYVRKLLQNTTLSKLPRPSKQKPLSISSFDNVSINMTYLTLSTIRQAEVVPLVEKVLQLTTTFAPEDPPWNVSYSELEKVDHQLVVAGIDNGSYTPVPEVNLTLVAEAALDLVNEANKADQVVLNNGWVRGSPQGIFGSHYVARALAAVSGTSGGQTLDQTIYASNAAISPLAVSQGYSTLFTFSSRPPIQSDGFWSLTYYLPDLQFFANPLDQYSLGDRSNLTYPNGSLVYGGPESSSTDGTFQILVQSIATPPPANWTSNWLPAPANATAAVLALRLYAPTESMINGSWEYPVVTKIPAIKG